MGDHPCQSLWINYTFVPGLAVPMIYGFFFLILPVICVLTNGPMNGGVDDKNRDNRNKSMNHLNTAKSVFWLYEFIVTVISYWYK